MARYSAAEALRLIMQEDLENDEGDFSDDDGHDSSDGDYLPAVEIDSLSDSEDHVSGESEESEDDSGSDEEPVSIAFYHCD